MNEIIHKIKGYLGHGVFIANISNPNSIHINLDNFVNDLGLGQVEQDLYFGYIKLKLRPLESLTDEEIGEIHTLIIIISFNKKEFIRELKAHIHQRQISYDLIEYLHSIHIDYQDLIGQGLAVEFTNKGKTK